MLQPHEVDESTLHDATFNQGERDTNWNGLRRRLVQVPRVQVQVYENVNYEVRTRPLRVTSTTKAMGRTSTTITCPALTVVRLKKDSGVTCDHGEGSSVVRLQNTETESGVVSVKKNAPYPALSRINVKFTCDVLFLLQQLISMWIPSSISMKKQ